MLDAAAADDGLIDGQEADGVISSKTPRRAKTRMVGLDLADFEGKLSREITMLMQVVTQAAGGRLLRAAILSRETGQHSALP